MPAVEIQVADGSSQAICSSCGTTIPVINDPRKKAHNYLHCPACGIALILTNDDGEDLNLWWASLKTPLDRQVARLFQVARFPSRAIADQWGRFQQSHDAAMILASARRLAKTFQEKNKGGRLGDVAWRQIMASVGKTHSRLKEPQLYEEPTPLPTRSADY